MYKNTTDKAKQTIANTRDNAQARINADLMETVDLVRRMLEADNCCAQPSCCTQFNNNNNKRSTNTLQIASKSENFTFYCTLLLAKT